MILAFDPSSTCTGYAVLTGLARNQLIGAGRFFSEYKKNELPILPPWLSTHLMQPELKAAWRVAAMVRDAVDIIHEYKPQRIVVEIPSGRAGKGSKNGAKSSLSVYGMGAGAIWTAANLAAPGIVAPVTELQWTPSRGDKYTAQIGIAALYPNYDPQKDKGADTSDAIGLARWWIMHQGFK